MIPATDAVFKIVPPPAATKRGHTARQVPIDARKVDVEHTIPFVGGEGLDGAHRRNRGVVHDNVDASKRLPGAIHHGGDGLDVSDVGGQADRRSSLGADCFRVLVRAGAVQIGNRDGCAFCREALSDRSADARGTAGHQRALACQAHQRVLNGESIGGMGRRGQLSTGRRGYRRCGRDGKGSYVGLDRRVRAGARMSPLRHCEPAPPQPRTGPANSIERASASG